MKIYTDCEIEILHLEDEIVRTSPIVMPEDEIEGDIGSF